ncbi:hypothetical protein [Roseicyclus sp.]|jgi:hypothetical protein
MSPPDVNLEKQKRRHWPVFVGVAAALAVAIVTWLALEGQLDEAEEDTAPTVMEHEVAE